MIRKTQLTLLFSAALLLAFHLSAASAQMNGAGVRMVKGISLQRAPSNQNAALGNPDLLFPIILNLPGDQNPTPPQLIQPSDQAQGTSTTALLEVSLNEAEPGLKDITFYGRPAPVPNLNEDFTFIALPDTQFYSRWFPSTFITQTQWIVDQQENLNIVYTAHEGDIVDIENETAQWDNADAAMSLLEEQLPGLPDGIPYGIIPGNHDLPTTNFNKYFGVSRFAGRDYYGGRYASNNNDNNYALISAAGMDFIVINLEFQPGPGALDWADALLKTNPGRRGIVVSHSILNIDDSWSYQGIFDALKDNPNLFLMLSGHTHSPSDGAAQRTETGDNGNTIFVLQANYQDFPNGGNGYLRVMRFSPVNQKIYVSTYSPWLDAYLTDVENDFDLEYDMTTREDFHKLGTVSGVSPGGNASLTWSGLELGTVYEWYVEISDSGGSATGPHWRFTTWLSVPTCYSLNLTHTGSGTPVGATPPNSYGCDTGEYQSGEIVTLNGAQPDPGWDIAGWSGTQDDSSLETSNTLTMPDGPHSAGVIYTDTTPPETTLTSVPPDPSASAQASFSFSSSEPGSSFECQLDGLGYKICQSPLTYNELDYGGHSFSVRAIDLAGNTDPTPAGLDWNVYRKIYLSVIIK